MTMRTCSACGCSTPAGVPACAVCGSRTLALSAGREQLLAALAAVLPFTTRGTAGLIAAGADGRATVTGAARDSGATCAVEGVRVDSSGAAAVPLEHLAQLLRHSEGTAVRIEADPTRVAVTIDPDVKPVRRFEFLAQEPGAVPAGAAPADALALELDSEALRGLVARVCFAADRRENPAGRWATTGVLVSVAKGKLALVATDTFLLALAETPVDVPKKVTGTYLVPERLLRALADASRRAERAELVLSARLVALSCGDFRAWSAVLYERTFPAAWERARTDPPHSVTLSPRRLLADVEAALALADREDPRVVFATEPGCVTISAQSSALGSARVPMRVPEFRGPRVEIPLDGARLAQCLAAYAGHQEVTIRWTAADRPVAIVATGPSGGRCVQVPMLWRDREGTTEGADAA